MISEVRLREMIATADGDPEKLEMANQLLLVQEGKKRALEVLLETGQIDGSHHKLWTIDQAVRALTNCPVLTQKAKDVNGVEYTYDAQGESAEYQETIRQYCDGEDGPDTYWWETGTPP